MRGSYMKVEHVLRYLQNVTSLNQKVIGLKQYKIEGDKTEGNYFKCKELSEMVGERLFRVMECDVVQFLPMQKGYWAEIA